MLPPLAAEPLPAPAEPPRERSPEFPDPLDPDAPERDCSLPVDSRDWAIDHSFFENWERPGGRPPERSSSLVQHGCASRRRNGLLRPISHKPCLSIARSDFLLTTSACTRRLHPGGGVRTPMARPMRNRVTEQAGTITRLPSLLFYEESRFPPSLPWPSSPTETPAAIPAGVSPCQPTSSAAPVSAARKVSDSSGLLARPRPDRPCYGSRVTPG
jgi:hypothetical protein